jgi:hypothetical protein
MDVVRIAFVFAATRNFDGGHQMKIKEGCEAGFAEAVTNAAQIGRGKLGWSGQARMFVALGLDRQFGVYGKKRLRKKKMKRLIQSVFLREIGRNLE